MKFDPDLHHRRSIRLKGWDYTSPGAYFMTICAQDRACLFGDAENALMTLSEAGRMVEHWWRELTNKFGVVLSDFVIMPNHLHGIILIAATPESLLQTNSGQTHRSAPTLGEMAQWFKTMSTNEYIRGVKASKWLPFNKRLWQRNYYEHIILDEEDLSRIRQYIIDNPACWLEDEFHPTNS